MSTTPLTKMMSSDLDLAEAHLAHTLTLIGRTRRRLDKITKLQNRRKPQNYRKEKENQTCDAKK